MIDWTQFDPSTFDPFSGMLTTIYFIVFFILFPCILYIKFNGATNFLELIKNGIYDIFGYIENFFIPIFRFLNPYPFQSMLLQFFFCYLIFFGIFITHPIPFLKRWSTATDIVLYGFLIFFLLALFIQFVVPFDGWFISKQGFAPNKRHLKQNIGVYAGLLMSIFVIMLLAIGISYLAAHHTSISWLVLTIAIVIMSLMILVTIFTFIQQFTAINLPSLSDIVSTQMLINVVALIQKNIMKTPASIYILLAFEISFIVAYFLLPMFGNMLYLKAPGNKNYDWLLKTNIKGMNSAVLSQKELLSATKGHINIDWSNVADLNDLDLRTKLYDAGYTVATEPAAAAYVRENQDKVASISKTLRDLEDKLKRLKDEQQIDKDYSSKQLLQGPIYTDARKTLGTFEQLKTGDDYNYKYTLSSWFFIHNQPPNFRFQTNNFASLLNYGNKPNILYNLKTQVLQIKVKTNTGEKIVYESKDFPLQRWNNIVINYDYGTLDIFINAKLVASIPSIIPDMKFANVIAGEDNGISGGICNVVYYSGNLSKDRIEFYYKLLKAQRFPVFADPIAEFFVKPWDRVKNFYYLHPLITILGVIGGISIPIVVGHRYKKSSSQIVPS
jgi:hypothetical protein